MLWSKVDKLWQDRLGKTSEGDVSWTTEQWPVPGESPLEVRVCKRQGYPLSKFADIINEPKTSVLLHLTAGYGLFQQLMGNVSNASVNFMLGRCGTPYLLVPTEYRSWHTSHFNHHSVGIEIDNIANLIKRGNNLQSVYGNDTYCTVDDKGVFLEKDWKGIHYWSTLTEAQYTGLARLVKAICFKHQIPRVILPEPQRYDHFTADQERTFTGICSHINIDPPPNRFDIGPYFDWQKLIQYAGLTEADCFHAPASLTGSWNNATGGHAAPAQAAPSGGTGQQSSLVEPVAPAKDADGKETLPAPVSIDNHTLRIHVGKHGGRVCLSVKQPGDPMPTSPAASDAPAAKAPGKRDDFIQACLNFLGAPYKAGSRKPAEGVDGAAMIALALRRIELFKTDDEMPADATHLSALWHTVTGSPKDPPEGILPGDLVWFGKGDHDNDPLEHPMVYLGGGRALGPIPDGGPQNGAVQVIAIEKVPEHFTGWMHIDDLGEETQHTEHPGEPPPAGAKLTGALLPPTPAAQYDALKKIVERAKGKWDDGKGKVNLVGVKSMHDRCMISPRPDDWNDTLFAAFLDEAGNKCVLDLRASLNPGTDSNKAETWQLWEGSWKFKLGAGDSVDKALQPDGKVKGWEDKEGWGAPRPLDHETPAKPDDVQPAAPKGKDEAKKSDAPKNPERKKPDDKPADTKGKFVFDAAGKKLSMKFGLRMMRALLDWELHDEGGQRVGCIYSSNGDVKPDKAHVAGVAGQEWPIVEGLEVAPARTVNVGGTEYKAWKAFGMEWGGTGATNCCNSQMAAMFKALGDGKMRIKKDSGVVEVDVVNDSPKADDVLVVKNKVAVKPSPAPSLGYVFARVWIGGMGAGYYKDNGGKQGKNLFGGFDLTGPAWAMKYLGIGEEIGKVGCGDEDLKKVRIGDSGQWMAHNWLVGDIRYEVAVKGRKTPVYVDQSDFARAENPQPQEKDDRYAGYKLTRDDCEWMEANEAEFESRLTHFLSAKSLAIDGEDHEIVSIRPVSARVFSANAASKHDKSGPIRGTLNGEIYDNQGGTWVVNEGDTKQSWLGLGISRGWVPFAWNVSDGVKHWGFARWYGNAGGG